MTHGDLTRSILIELSPHGIAWANQTGALKDATGRLVRYGLPGSSDILGCIKGRFIGIEVKVGRDRQRTNQADFAAAVERAGGIYILARSIDDVTGRLVAEGVL